MSTQVYETGRLNPATEEKPRRVISINYGRQHLLPKDAEEIGQAIMSRQTVIAHPDGSVMVVDPKSETGRRIAELYSDLNGISFHDLPPRQEIFNIAYRTTHGKPPPKKLSTAP